MAPSAVVAALVLVFLHLCTVAYAFSDRADVWSPQASLNASSIHGNSFDLRENAGRTLLRRTTTRGRTSRSRSRSRNNRKHRFSNTKRANTKRVYTGEEAAKKKEEMIKREEELRLAREERMAADQKLKDELSKPADLAKAAKMRNDLIQNGVKQAIKFAPIDMGVDIEDDDTLPFRVTDFPSGSSLKFSVKGTMCMYEEFETGSIDDGDSKDDTDTGVDNAEAEFTMRGAWFVPTGGKVSVIVISPSKGLLYRSANMASEGYWDAPLTAVGSYRICVTSGTNQKLVLAMDIGSNQDRAESPLGMVPGRALEDVLDDEESSDKTDLTEAVERLSDVLRDVESEQKNLHLRLQRNHQTVSSNESRVFYAGLLEGLVVVAMGIFQVLFMKQLFAEKNSNFSGGRMGV